jgi:signal transduction histidine kinase
MDEGEAREPDFRPSLARLADSDGKKSTSRPTRRQRRTLARQRFGAKLLTTFAVILTVVTTLVFGVAGMFIYKTNERVLEREVTRHLESVARLAASDLAQRSGLLARANHPVPEVSLRARTSLAELCRSLKADAQVSEIVVFRLKASPDGPPDVLVLGSSGGNEPAVLGRLLADSSLSIADAVESRQPTSSSIWGDELPNKRWQLYKSAYMPIELPASAGHTLVGVELPAEYAEAVSEVYDTFVGLGVLAGLTVLAVAIFLVKQRVEVPVYRLWRAMEGEKPGRVRVRYPDEIGVLTEHYNHMVDRLEDKDQKLKLLYKEARETASYLKGYSNSLVAGVPEGVVAVDTQGRLSVWNASAQRILRKVCHLGDPLPDPDTPLAQALTRALAGSRTDRAMIILDVPGGEGDGEDPDGQRLVELTCAPFVDEDGTLLGAVALVNDRTELEQFRRAAVRNERLAAIGSLGGGLAHEIKNPLGAIMGFAELIERGGDTKRLAGRLRDEIVELDTFLNQFLSFARDNSIRREPTDLDTLLRRSVTQSLMQVGLDPDEARNALGANGAPAKLLLNGAINIRVEVDPLPTLALDGTLLRSVFTNLATNALQAMIEASQASTKGGELLVRAHKVGRSVYVRFRDTGPGIPIESREKIFDPLFTTRAEGTGLGLAICNKTVDAHGGKLSIRDAPGGGAEFVIRLPMVAAAGSGPTLAPEPGILETPSGAGSGSAEAVTAEAEQSG